VNFAGTRPFVKGTKEIIIGGSRHILTWIGIYPSSTCEHLRATPSHVSIIRIYSIPLGAQKNKIKPCVGFKPTQGFSNLEEFLAGLRFEQKGKLEDLTTNF
jgi:hypothetical protein